MNNAPGYHSDEDLLKRLQTLQQGLSMNGIPPPDADAQAREIVSEFAYRIYADPEKWGIAQVPEAFRDDAAQDALLKLLYGAQDFADHHETVAKWYSGLVEDRFRDLWSTHEAQAGEATGEGPDSEGGEAASSRGNGDRLTNSRIFESPTGPWPQFEQDFPRDAFALRLRFLLKHTPEEMMVMLDAPSSRAVTLRVERARERFRMFCAQAGYARREVSAILEHLSEGVGE